MTTQPNNISSVELLNEIEESDFTPASPGTVDPFDDLLSFFAEPTFAPIQPEKFAVVDLTMDDPLIAAAAMDYAQVVESTPTHPAVIFEAYQNMSNADENEIAEANLPASTVQETAEVDLDALQQITDLNIAPEQDQTPENGIAREDGSTPEFAGTLLTAVEIDPEQVAAEQIRLAREQVLNALHGTGLTVVGELDLERDTYYDPELNERLICGIFQRDQANPTQDCRAMLVSLTPGTDGLGFQADATEFGITGSMDAVCPTHDAVRQTLDSKGVDEALTQVEEIEFERLALEQTPELDRPAPSKGRGIAI